MIPVFHSQFGGVSHHPRHVDSSENFAPHSSSASSDSSAASNTFANPFSVANKRVVITGAARGIGEYTSRLYAAEGAQVLLVDHPSMESQLQTLAVSSSSFLLFFAVLSHSLSSD